MADIRPEELAEFIADQIAGDRLSPTVRGPVDALFIEGEVDIVEVAKALMGRYRMVPRSDVIDTEYGWRTSADCIANLVEKRADALQCAANMRAAGSVWANAEAVERTGVPAWSVIPLPEEK